MHPRRVRVKPVNVRTLVSFARAIRPRRRRRDIQRAGEAVAFVPVSSDVDLAPHVGE
jgi:hypothetical protein